MLNLSEVIHIVAATDSGYEQHTAVMLASLFENNKDVKFSIHLLHSDKAREINKLKHFVEKKRQAFFSYQIKEESLKDFKITHHVSLATYFRLLIPQLLPSDVDKILYLDSDLVVLANISDFWNTNLEGFDAAAVACEFDRYEQLKMQPGFDYFNAGVMLWNVKRLRENGFTHRAIDYLQINVDNILFWDQDVINYMMQGKVKPVDRYWNIMSADVGVDKSKAKIFHFAGSIKPWTFPQQNGYDKLYFKYLIKTSWFYKCLSNRHFLKLALTNFY